MPVKQTVYIDRRAEKELTKFSKQIQFRFQALFEVLAKDGKLEEPFAKKLSGVRNLFEIRVKYKGQWRALYAYIESKQIVILSAFAKKTQKTPLLELEKATNRMQDYK